MNTNSLTVFNADSAVVSYTNKKGAALSVTAEGALFKGGDAIKALKDIAMTSAQIKTLNGRYRPAHDIIAASFPAIAKSCEKLLGDGWSNKSNFETFLNAVRREQPKEGKKFSIKQANAHLFAQLLHKDLFDIKAEAGETVDNAADQQ